MRKTVCLLIVLIPLLVFAKSFDSEDLLEKITNKSYKPKIIKELYHMSDGETYASLSEDGKRILLFSYRQVGTKDTIFDVEKIKDCPVQSIEGFQLDSLEQKILVYTNSEKRFRRAFVADYYVYNRFRNKIEPLSQAGRQQDAVFSPNGRMVAFSRENNLFVKKLDFNTEIAVTTDGEKGSVINGTSDWVYEEEFSKTRFFEWSPDSKFLAYVRFDESEVRRFSFQWFGRDSIGNDVYPVCETYKYPCAGSKNSIPHVRLYDVFYKSTKTIDLSGEKDFYIPAITWDLTSEKLFVFRLNRNQNQLDLIACNPKSTVTKVILSERSDTYIDFENINSFQFLDGERFVWMSEADGFRHLALYSSSSGKKLQSITSGVWDVTAFYGFDKQKKLFYYQAARRTPLERELYCVDLKGKERCLTPEKGTHDADFNRLFTFCIHRYSTLLSPDVFDVYNAAGVSVRKLEDNHLLKEELELQDLPFKEFFMFKTPDQTELNGWMVKPRNFDPSNRYPVVLLQYSGPNTQEVRNRFSMDWELYLAEEGFLVVCVDGRGTGARGEYFRKCTYMNLGAKEAEDQICTANYLSTLPFVDASRIGIWGWSYGGYVVLRSMIDGKGVFKAGVAVAPVTDWKLYDTAYTERFMRRPQENFRGYEQSTLLDKAADLKGSLLLVHGTADDNVHLQQTLLFSEKLIEAGVQFDMQLYPNKNHSLLGEKTRRHLYTKMSRFFKDKL